LLGDALNLGAAGAGLTAIAALGGKDKFAQESASDEKKEIMTLRYADHPVARERVVIPGYDEPNTPPHVSVSAELRAAVTDPAAFVDGQLNLNQAIFVRFFDPSRESQPKAILVLVSGGQGGANGFAPLAEALVPRFGGDLEVWSLDRRWNLLEDATAMIKAESRLTVESALEAAEYYVRDPNGPGGYIANHPEAVPFLAEWGLDVVMRDAKAVVDVARTRAPKVFFGGMSSGSMLSQLFAAYDFDGTPGYSLISGLVLVDGTLFPGMAPSRSEEEYLDKGWMHARGTTRGARFFLPGLNQLRSGSASPFPSAPEEGDRLNTICRTQIREILAQLVLADPEGPSPAPQLWPWMRLPPATNEAMFALGADDEFVGGISGASLGFLDIPAGKKLDDIVRRVPDRGIIHPNPDGLFRAQDLGVDAQGKPILQRWNKSLDLRAVGLKGKEWTDLALFARQHLYGNGKASLPTAEANLVDWFFPTRLWLDMGLVSNLDSSAMTPRIVKALTERGDHAITVLHNHEVNVPILCIGGSAGAAWSEDIWRPYQKTVSTAPKDFRVAILEDYTHIDMISSHESAVPDLVYEFLTRAIR
jgi:pimeloyl-ACP methyl ester carboxylesterase